jgi:hypothetical protein
VLRPPLCVLCARDVVHSQQPGVSLAWLRVPLPPSTELHGECLPPGFTQPCLSTYKLALSEADSNRTRLLPSDPFAAAENIWSTTPVALPSSVWFWTEGRYNTMRAVKRPCDAGKHCPANTAKGIVCPPGFCCPTGSASPTACPANYFCLEGSAQPAPCARGYYCPPQAANPTPCRPGYTGYLEASIYHDDFASHESACLACEPGTYVVLPTDLANDSCALVPCTECDAGTYCPGTLNAQCTKLFV